jgi:protein-ribulosamine 3-kinase
MSVFSCLQVATGQVGLEMMRGEYESMSAIHSLVPDFVPKPIAWGSFAHAGGTHFLLFEFHNLSEFHDLSEAFPDPVKVATKLVALHKGGESPTGQFGFHVPTYNDGLVQDNSWKATWEEFFVNKLRQLLKQEESTQGPSPELDNLSTPIFERVIPRLLRVLETDGRTIRPSLIHGNLWYGNASTDQNTGEPIIFGACSFWAHNECNTCGLPYVGSMAHVA